VEGWEGWTCCALPAGHFADGLLDGWRYLEAWMKGLRDSNLQASHLVDILYTRVLVLLSCSKPSPHAALSPRAERTSAGRKWSACQIPGIAVTEEVWFTQRAQSTASVQAILHFLKCNSIPFYIAGHFITAMSTQHSSRQTFPHSSRTMLQEGRTALDVDSQSKQREEVEPR